VELTQAQAQELLEVDPGVFAEDAGTGAPSVD